MKNSKPARSFPSSKGLVFVCRYDIIKVYAKQIPKNKKGLSFGLEIADLFAWSHFNNRHGIARTYPSKAKIKRIKARLKKVEEIMKKTLIKDGVEEMTGTKIKSVANDRVSKFTNAVKLISSN